MKITTKDIIRRSRNKDKVVLTESININDIMVYHNDTFLLNNADYKIRNWGNINPNTNIAFDEALDIFGEICINCNESVINTYKDFLIENVVKVRNAKQLANSIKYRNSRLKTKIVTKINNRLNNIGSALPSSISAINSKLSGKRLGIQTGVTPKQKAETVDECFNSLLDEANKMIECDRILSNINIIDRSLNLHHMLKESNNKPDVLIRDISSSLNSCHLPFINKYNAALEACKYFIETNHMKENDTALVTTITEFFLAHNDNVEENIKDIKKISATCVYFDEVAFSDVDYLYENYKKEEDKEMTVSDVLESWVLELTKDEVIDMIKPSDEEKERKEIDKIIEEFRDQCKKNKDDEHPSSISRLRAIINKIYTKSPHQIVNATPKIFTLIRMSLIIGTASINPIIGLVHLIADNIIRVELSKKETTRIMDKYNKEIETVEAKIEKEEDDEKRERLEKYLEALNSDLKKITEYERGLYSAQENEDRDFANMGDDDFDFDFGDDEWDIDFEECASIVVVSDLMQSISEGLLDADVNGIVYNNLFKINNDSLSDLTDLSITVPNVLDKNILFKAMINERARIRESENKDINSNYRLDILNENIMKINNSYSTKKKLSMKEHAYHLNCINEIIKLQSINEMDFSNTLKIALNNLKHSANKLNDKQKKISDNIDANVNIIAKNVSDSALESKRDRILTGKILPSASKTIKLALGAGVAWAIDPAIAVIGVLAGLGCSTIATNKERQIILDDIEIELRMCERYLRQAEDRNDLEAVRQIEKTQRSLQRAQQRIKYKLKVVYKKDVPDIDND